MTAHNRAMLQTLPQELVDEVFLQNFLIGLELNGEFRKFLFENARHVVLGGEGGGGRFLCVHDTRKLCNILKRCRRLTSLDISDTMVFLNLQPNSTMSKDDHLARLAQTLTECQHLSLLNMSNNNLQSTGIVRFPAMFQALPMLTHLNLSLNLLGDEGVEILSPSLRGCHRLQALDLGQNLLTASGISTLCDALRHCPALNHLDVKGTPRNRHQHHTP